MFGDATSAWMELKPAFNQSTNRKAKQSLVIQIESGTVSYDGLSVRLSLQEYREKYAKPEDVTGVEVK
ncbi:Magnesium-chelatase subunit H [Gossypium australe]|uniref:Magnesium-chelatase subunit H n=1 Tax=Gossypium australe TaxID=47621 RepID=A0A5B6X3S8_9ROSI|nr:Magnesium-chelatase subunit H [Gossypium australe]